MKIKTSLDWEEVSHQLGIQMSSIGYNPDLRKMLKNIDSMVSELSKLEVDARRIRKPEYTKESVDSINKAIDHLEKLLLIAKLMN